MSIFLYVTLNARLRPMDRFEVYEDHLLEVLEARFPGSGIDGGGTLLSAEGEPEKCDLDVDLVGDAAAGLTLVIETLEALGAPRGSTIRMGDGEPVVFGVTDGVGLYLNGTDLPAHVYAECDINDLIARLTDGLGEHGRMDSYWQGPRETALYFYGPSAATMRAAMRPVLDSHPLARRSRLVARTEPVRTG